MTSQNKRLPKGFFRLETQPEEGAQVAGFVDAVIPGGRGFVQQLYRAKRDFLQGVSHLLDAQIHELEHIDTAIQDDARSQGSEAGGDRRLSPRMKTLKQLMEEATRARGQEPKQGEAHPQAQAPAQPKPAAPVPATAPEKIKLT
ncbi:hypothetical protein DRW03_28475 [Corallococcus sp. H22C18031201]|uniref:hypothetical protein n=1 Tax=Citreicoccus inhibens TaxID=2849499 RepID=UPI000E73CC57|nr:hypothetical protein [Citreicoccus inhibens]MBU8897890.1 hypothetical protein [Citreicoccus inhibens]RJS17007.1 hypothetical protein DRW03_28475 [Corallococcus sp. H22C18031201]